MDTEGQVIEILRNHYQTCKGKPAPLKALKQHYGQGFKFENLGLGKYGAWMQINSDKFQIEKSTTDFLFDADKGTVTEEDLLIVVIDFFSKSENFNHRKHVLGHIRKIYGEGSFSNFGYGTFPEFLAKHNLNMGI